MTAVKPATIGLYHKKPNESEILKVADAAQHLVTGGRATHITIIAISPQGDPWTFESTLGPILEQDLPASGVWRTPGVKPAHWYREPVIDLTDEQAGLLWLSCNVAYFLDRPYPIRSLLLDFAIYPTRAFWQRLGWVPFSGGPMIGVCSKFVGERILQANWYPFHDRPALLAPNDFAISPAWRDL